MVSLFTALPSSAFHASCILLWDCNSNTRMTNLLIFCSYSCSSCCFCICFSSWNLILDWIPWVFVGFAWWQRCLFHVGSWWGICIHSRVSSSMLHPFCNLLFSFMGIDSLTYCIISLFVMSLNWSYEEKSYTVLSNRIACLVWPIPSSFKRIMDKSVTRMHSKELETITASNFFGIKMPLIPRRDTVSLVNKKFCTIHLLSFLENHVFNHNWEAETLIFSGEEF